jgi:hypothetical protein
MKRPRRLDNKTGRPCFERNRPTVYRRPALVAPLQRGAGGVQLQNATGVILQLSGPKDGAELSGGSRVSGSRPAPESRHCMVMVTPPTAAETSAPTLGPLSCRITPFAFCNWTPPAPAAIAPPAPPAA